MKNFLSRSIITISIVLLSSSISRAQFVNLGSVLSASTSDAELILQEYVRPFTTALGANLNSGWYNTAKVHDLLGFHLTFTTSVALIPDAAKTYDLNELDLVALYDANDNIARTAAGEKLAGPTLRYEQTVPGLANPVTLAEFDHPGGTGLGFIPSPMISAGIGLIKGIEIDGRYMPTIKYGSDKENSVDLWGIGVKHDLKQWIPVVKNVPVFQLSIQYGYTSLKWHTAFNPLTPASLGAADQTTGINWDDQSMDFQTKAHTASLLVGANLPVVCFYGGVGFSMAKTNLVTNGWYPIPTVITEAGPTLGDIVVTNQSAMENPIDIQIKAKEGGITKPRLNAGIRFKLAIITIHFDYTYANYSVATAGLGITLR